MLESKKSKHQDEEVIEEDWSQFGPSSDNTMFDYYETQKFPLGQGVEMKLQCVESLTPLDMMNLSNGISDSTGNRVWSGAIMFMVYFAIVPLLQSSTFIEEENGEKFEKMRSSQTLKDNLFAGKRVLELGAGTGSSSIAVVLSCLHSKAVLPDIVFTDNDETVLKLCEQNCKSNLGAINVSVENLGWGTKETVKSHSEKIHSFDTVIATDVIYDLSALQPLFETASLMVNPGGIFILAHVPRASIDCDLKEICPSLERKILEQSRLHNFKVLVHENGIPVEVGDYALRPKWLEEFSNDLPDFVDLSELDAIGASIMIFKNVK